MNTKLHITGSLLVGFNLLMFERFTEKAKKSMLARKLEDLGIICWNRTNLLGLIGEGTGVAAKVLKSLALT